MPLTTSRAERQNRISKHRSERLPTVFASAASALQSAFLVNGGGAVALLAVYGQLLSVQPHHPALVGLSRALLTLVIGSGLAAAATGMSFLAQYGYMMRRQSTLGRLAKYLTWLNITLVALSLACFLAAGAFAYAALAYSQI